MTLTRRTGIVGIGLLLAGTGSASEPLFPGEYEFQWAMTASFIETKDLNHDGHADLVLLATDGSVQIARGLGDGSFALGAAFHSGVPGIDTPILADFDADGNADLAIAGDDPQNGTPSTLSVILGRGDGSFQPPVSLQFERDVIDLAAADINADGVLDLVSLHRHPKLVSSFIGVGDGTFTQGPTSSLASSPIRFASGDFNGDNAADFVATIRVHNGPRGVSTLINAGDGAFVEQPLIDVGRSPFTIRTSDLDADGHIDALVNGDTYILLRGNGDGTFAPPESLGPFSGSSAFHFADVNEDGFDDIVARASLSGAFSVLYGEGDAAFSERREFSAGPLVLAQAFADFDQDGEIDAFVSVGSGAYMLLRGTGDDDFHTRLRLQTQTPTSDVLVADLNNDGALDLVGANHGFYGWEVYQPGDQLSIYLGDGAGSFELAPQLPSVWAPRYLTQGDFNADLVTDLAVTSTEFPRHTVFLGVGDGTFEPGRSQGNVEYMNRGVASDFTGDGRLDLAYATNQEGGAVHVLPGLGDGWFDEPIVFPIDDYVNGVTGADFNSDGRTDIAAAIRGGPATLLLSNGDATFKVLEISDAIGCTAVEPVDFNRDGAVDVLATRRSSQDDTSVLLAIPGDGAGGFGTPVVSLLGGDSPWRLTPADLDGDGEVDLAVTYFFSSSIHVLFGDGGGGFSGLRRFMGGGSLGTTNTAAADLDRNGTIDLVGDQFCFPISGPGGASTCDHEMVVLLNGLEPAQLCVADLAPPLGVLDFDDILAFLQAFGAGDPIADLSPAYGVLDFNDVAIFLAVFVSGCP